VSSWKGQSRGTLLGYKIFVALLKYGGLKPAYFILYFVALYYFLFSPSSSRIVFDFYRSRFKFGFFKAIISVYRNYYVFGQVLLDKTATMAGFDSKFSFEFDGETYLREAAASNTGCLLISAHLGNFEMAGHMLERLNTRINILMVDAEHQHIRKYLSSVTRKSFHVIPIRDDSSHIYEINRALENHEILCMHGDRFVKESKTLECEFMGQAACFPSGPFYLAMKYAIPVSFVFAMKEGNFSYHFYATRPRLYPQQGSPAKRDEMIRTAISDYIAEMENKLTQYPLQWSNYYDFWNEARRL
jgi:predicted LPLAT superfamily acyltransferase